MKRISIKDLKKIKISNKVLIYSPKIKLYGSVSFLGNVMTFHGFAKGFTKLKRHLLPNCKTLAYITLKDFEKNYGKATVIVYEASNKKSN